MRILVLGANGMIGRTVLRVLAARPGWSLHGTLRCASARAALPPDLPARLHPGVDLRSEDSLADLFLQARPGVVINCAGLTKHQPDGQDPLPALLMNAVLPQRLARLCRVAGARLIQVSTDCVFSGRRGAYQEDDPPDATDVYGRSKALGEVSGPGMLTLRTSTIGHEWQTRHGLLEWFLAQTVCAGYTRARFSGLPTVTFAQVLRDHVIPNAALEGLYHVAGGPIAKDALLRLIAAQYGHAARITPDDTVVVDRSLDGTRFRAATGYMAPSWPQLVADMHADHLMTQSRHV
jgi:dTDP-4-dehydrorhamnose reductase